MGIKVLDEKTISRIAAGEVIERPASVVKELVENALDAGASRIEVVVKGGGIALVSVTDNGVGIPAAEVAEAFRRHATSKLDSFETLSSIASLGFRGEALPSIAAVAEVTLLTRQRDELAATLLALEDGRIIDSKKQARSVGTTVTVGNLFRNVPARLKFLKSVATENGRIADVVSRYALAYPEVAFTLDSDGKNTLKTAGRGILLDAVLDVYGREIAGKMLSLADPEAAWSDSGEVPTIRVRGLVGSPDLSRSGRGYLSFFINRRWVNSRLLAFAVEEAYHGMLMTDRHPVAVLNIEVPPEEVDVNIHPAKSEVKFRDDSRVFREVQRTVRRTLVGQAPVPGIEDIVATYHTPAGGLQPSWDSRPADRSALPAESGVQSTFSTSLPLLRVVGQVLGCYIVAEGPDGLYIIDQHAAHERVRFEEVHRQRQQRMEVQGLLEPATFEVTPQRDALLKSCREELAGFGFTLEAFGERTYLVRTVPALLAMDDWSVMLRDLLEELAGEEKSRWEEKIAASIACHGVVRRGQVLNIEEMRELVRQLEQCQSPHTCPHGRPTIIHISRNQIERHFGRTG